MLLMEKQRDIPEAMTREEVPTPLSPSLMKLLNQGPCEALGHRAQGRGPQEAL